MAGKIRLEDSGFLPIASIARAPINPIAKAGAKPPMAIIKPPETEKFTYDSPP